MTLEETKDVLGFLRGCYPAFYRNVSDFDWENILLAWSTLFSDDYYTFDDVFDAVKKCVTGELRVKDKKGMGLLEATDGGYRRFPPQPGVIVEALEEERESCKYALRLRAKRKKKGYYAQLLKAECEAESEEESEQRRLQACERQCLTGGVEDGQQDENRVVYAYVEPGDGLSARLPLLLRAEHCEPFRNGRGEVNVSAEVHRRRDAGRAWQGHAELHGRAV